MVGIHGEAGGDHCREAGDQASEVVADALPELRRRRVPFPPRDIDGGQPSSRDMIKRTKFQILRSEIPVVSNKENRLKIN